MGLIVDVAGTAEISFHVNILGLSFKSATLKEIWGYSKGMSLL